MDALKLLPCPFCGKEPVIYESQHWFEDPKFVVYCPNELCQMGTVETQRFTKQEDAVQVWNTRAKPAEAA